MNEFHISDIDVEKVDFLPAFMWICHECGAEHFERGICIEKPGVENTVDITILGPVKVRCDKCGTAYFTEQVY